MQKYYRLVASQQKKNNRKKRNKSTFNSWISYNHLHLLLVVVEWDLPHFWWWNLLFKKIFIVASDNLQMIWKLNHKKERSTHTVHNFNEKLCQLIACPNSKKILTWLEISEQWDINISNIQSFSVLLCAVHRQYADCHVTFLILTEPPERYVNFKRLHTFSHLVCRKFTDNN